VAGKITLTQTVVEGNITLSQGRLEPLTRGCWARLRIKHSDTEDADVPELTLGPETEVTTLAVDKQANAHLRIHRSARVASISWSQS
jgi:hypothetical protein